MDNWFIKRGESERFAVIETEIRNGKIDNRHYNEICDICGVTVADAICIKYKNSSDIQIYVVMGKDRKTEIIENGDDFQSRFKELRRFKKEDRSSFPYWFAHWCAFQLTALNIHAWKFKYLFHDFLKPWMRIFLTYEEVQKRHRYHCSHHLEYGLEHGFDKVDWEALMIDWECSGLTKEKCPRDCRAEMEEKVSDEKWKKHEKKIRMYLEPLLDRYGL